MKSRQTEGRRTGKQIQATIDMGSFIACKITNGIMIFNQQEVTLITRREIVKSNRLSKWLAGAIVVLVMSVFCGQAVSSGFIANMVVLGEGDTLTNKVFVKGQKYRIETEEDGQQIVIIVDQETNVTKVINVGEKAYLEVPCDDMRSLMNDPFQSLKYTMAIPDAAVKQLGTETVSGVECDKSAVSYGDVDLFTQWVSGKYELPLKIIAHSASDKLVELTNIKESAIDDELFAVPEGYAVMGEEQPQTPDEPVETGPAFPEWMKDAPSAELVELPLEKVMLAGEMVRIKVLAGKDIFVFGTNNHGGKSVFLAIPCLNGKPIDDSSKVFAEYGETRMFSFVMEGQAWPTSLTETPDQADEVLVRVDEGQVNMRMEYTKKP